MLKERRETPSVDQMYLAQLTNEVFMLRIADPRSREYRRQKDRIRDFTLTFEPKREMTEKERMIRSKMAWGAAIGKNLLPLPKGRRRGRRRRT